MIHHHHHHHHFVNIPICTANFFSFLPISSYKNAGSKFSSSSNEAEIVLILENRSQDIPVFP